MDANSGNTATLYNITANAPPTLTSRRDTPIPVPRSTQPQGQLSPITSSDNERPMGQQVFMLQIDVIETVYLFVIVCQHSAHGQINL